MPWVSAYPAREWWVCVKLSQPDKKGNAEVESFLISLKPDYTVTVLVSKECVFKDLNDVTAAQPK